MLITSITGRNVPAITFQELNDMRPNGHVPSILADPGGKLSAFAITEIPEAGYEAAISALMADAPECVGQDESLPASTLADGSTRRTFASEDGQLPACLQEAQALIRGFDALDAAVSRLIESVAGHPLGYVMSNGNNSTDSLSAFPHKSHVHSYKRRKVIVASSSHRGRHKRSVPDEDGDDDSGWMVPFHVDNGIILLVTPFPGQSLRVGFSDGSVADTRAVEPSHSVVCLVGRGLTHWLLQTAPDMAERFFPSPHAVPAMKSDGPRFRSVMARMKVAPLAAVPISDDEGATLKTFGRTFFNEDEKHHWTDSQICSADLHEHAFTQAMHDNCDAGKAYCWMGCYPLPADCPDVDRAVCFSEETNVTCSTRPGGKPMDPSCHWKCKPQTQDALAGHSHLKNEYCNGRMGMLMLGFDVEGKKENPCIVLFVEAWTLDSRDKFVAGCLGVALLGFAIEAMIALRRAVSRRKWRALDRLTAGYRRLIALACFASNLILGYLAMLVAMTYSVELFLCVVVGLVAGHAVFNLNAAVGESIDPCCSNQNDVAKRKRHLDLHSSRSLGEAEDRNTLLLVDGRPAGEAGGGAANGGHPSPVSNGTCCTESKPTSNTATAHSSMIDVKM